MSEKLRNTEGPDSDNYSVAGASASGMRSEGESSSSDPGNVCLPGDKTCGPTPLAL